MKCYWRWKCGVVEIWEGSIEVYRLFGRLWILFRKWLNDFEDRGSGNIIFWLDFEKVRLVILLIFYDCEVVIDDNLGVFLRVIEMMSW